MPVDFENSSAASNRITTTDQERRAKTLVSVLALAAVVSLAMAILASSRIPPEGRAELFQMQSALVVP